MPIGMLPNLVRGVWLIALMRAPLQLHKNKFLFTGDHLAYDPGAKHLVAFRDHCWYSWSEQISSMARLAEFDFEWVIAGHGDRVKLRKAEAKRQIWELVAWMKLPSVEWNRVLYSQF